MLWIIIQPILAKAVRANVLKGLLLPHVNRSGEIALVGSHRLRAMHVASPVPFAHVVVPLRPSNQNR